MQMRELDSASLRYNLGVANLSEMPKPATVDEETFIRNRQAPRGGWRWRVGKGVLRNLRDPLVACQPFEEVGQSRSSNEVANPHGAKETDYRIAIIKNYEPA